MRLALLIATVAVVLAGPACTAPSGHASKPEVNPAVSSPPKVEGPYFGAMPRPEPQLLAPSLLASAMQEYNGTFSPDGRAFYYTVDSRPKSFIAFTQLQADNTWSPPAVASFSGPYADYDPIFSPDGKRLFFSSQRPTADGQTPATSPLWHPQNKSHVWYVEANETGWASPVHVPLTGKGDYYNSITEDGVIYFNVWSEGDIYQAVPSAFGYSTTKLGPTINTSNGEGDPYVSPKGDYIIYRGYGPESLGQGDLFISFRQDGQWTKPRNLGSPINSVAHEMCPFVTADGKMFIFASNRLTELYRARPLQSVEHLVDKFRSADNGELNIYFTSTDFIERLRPPKLAPD